MLICVQALVLLRFENNSPPRKRDREPVLRLTSCNTKLSTKTDDPARKSNRMHFEGEIESAVRLGQMLGE